MVRTFAARTGLLIIALVTLTALTGVLSAQPGVSREARDKELATNTRDFLTRWLVQRDPETALKKYLSPLVRDARLLPAGAFGVSEYRDIFGGEGKLRAREISEDEVLKRLTAYLTAQLPPPSRKLTLETAFGPMAAANVAGTDLELSKSISGREPRQLPGLPAVAYTVRNWSDLSWTATSAVGFRTVLPTMIKEQRIDAQAVVLKLAAGDLDPSNAPALFMLWAAREQFPLSFQFVGLELPPTN